jgi:hypothetical protein
MKYQTQEITLPSQRKHLPDITISAQVAEGTGLCYHACGGDPSYGWMITHLESLKALSAPIDTEFEVRLLMEKVVGITDWNQGEKALIKPEIAIEFRDCLQTVRQDINQRLEVAMKASSMPNYLVEATMEEISEENYPVMRKALLYAFKIVS